jgi:hypothetical protein
LLGESVAFQSLALLVYAGAVCPMRHQAGAFVQAMLTWEPVSGFEPLTCRLQVGRSPAMSALPAPMSKACALEGPDCPECSECSFHDSFHSEAGAPTNRSRTVARA